MSHYPPNLHRDSQCKCKYCLTHERNRQQRVNHQRINHNYQQTPHPVMHGHLSGGGGPPPAAGGGVACLHARGKSPTRYQTVEHANYPSNKCIMVVDPSECRKNRFQELRKTWSEFARVCNCPNCRGSLQKERYLGKLVESADRVSSYKQHHSMTCDEECCCSADSIPPSTIPQNHQHLRPTGRLKDNAYDQEQMPQQHEGYCGIYQKLHQQENQQNVQQHFPYHEVSSDEHLPDCPGNVGCSCLTCACRSNEKTYRGGGSTREDTNPPGTILEGTGLKRDDIKKERIKHRHY